MSRQLLAALVATSVIALFAARGRADGPSQARTILVDEGGSYEVAVHPDFVTVFYLPDKIQKALASDTRSYEIKSIGATSLAIRPLRPDAKPANLALATDSIKVSVVLRITTAREGALTQVTFKRADVEAELQRRIAEGVHQRTAELEAKIGHLQRTIDAELPKLADDLIASRLLQRREIRRLGAIERNDDHVVVEVTEVIFVGEDAYLAFVLENRNKAPYRVAGVEVRDGVRDRASLIRLISDAAETAGAGVLGVVRPGGKGRGIAVVRRSDDLIGKPLRMVVAGQGGRDRVVVDRIILR